MSKTKGNVIDPLDVIDMTSLAIVWNANEKTEEKLAALIVSRLRKLQAGMGIPARPPIASASSPTLSPPPILFVHPATNDELYSRRERELAWLDNCAKDALIRIATVTGVGGLGKTSIVGHWIEKARGWQHRAFRGVFFYSFYSDRDPAHFFAAFLQFVCEREKIAAFPADRPLHHLAATAVRKWCYLVVLDGLEVLQHDESDPHYGWIHDGALNEFVARAGAVGPSLLVLTSRFPFPEVTREHPEAARACELPLLTDDEGADLLAHCGLDGGREKLGGYSHQFGGHPLALRLFAGACLAQPFDEPETVSRHLLAAGAEGSDEDPKRRQFRKLLLWLQKKLPAEKRRLLQLVALFREPVPTATLAALATGLDAMKADFDDCDAAHLRFLLDALVRDHLLQREEAPGSDTARWAAHPIVREVFRGEALASGDTVAQQFAGIVAGKGEGGAPRSVAELQPILEAIEVLLASGDFKAANELYRGRLGNGYAFQDIPAPQQGLRCARGFIEPKERRAALEQALGLGQLAYYLNEVALLGSIFGEMEEVEQGYAKQNEIEHAVEAWNSVSTGLQNLAEAQTLRGALREAARNASEALFYAGVEEAQTLWSAAQRPPKRRVSIPSHDATGEIRSRAYRAQALSLAGELPSASRDFAAADTIQREEGSNNDALYALPSILWCRHRLRLDEADAARRLTEANRVICEDQGWNDDIARCDLLVGELNLEASDRDSAARRIGEAVRVFREARLGKYLRRAACAGAAAGEHRGLRGGAAARVQKRLCTETVRRPQSPLPAPARGGPARRRRQGRQRRVRNRRAMRLLLGPARSPAPASRRREGAWESRG